MRWLLAACCGLAVICVSVALNPTLQISQKPRFYGMTPKGNITICCFTKFPEAVSWFKAPQGDMDAGSRKKLFSKGKKIYFETDIKQTRNCLYMSDLQLNDSGLYFCLVNATWGPGTAVQVAKLLNVDRAEYRSKVKDGLIILQALVLAGCVAATLLRHRQLKWEEKDIIYEDPQTDHIYEGLAVETCGGGLYEELSVYAEAEVPEAPWQ